MCASGLEQISIAEHLLVSILQDGNDIAQICALGILDVGLNLSPSIKVCFDISAQLTIKVVDGIVNSLQQIAVAVELVSVALVILCLGIGLEVGNQLDDIVIVSLQIALSNLIQLVEVFLCLSKLRLFLAYEVCLLCIGSLIENVVNLLKQLVILVDSVIKLVCYVCFIAVDTVHIAVHKAVHLLLHSSQLSYVRILVGIFIRIDSVCSSGQRFLDSSLGCSKVVNECKSRSTHLEILLVDTCHCDGDLRLGSEFESHFGLVPASCNSSALTTHRDGQVALR